MFLYADGVIIVLGIVQAIRFETVLIKNYILV